MLLFVVFKLWQPMDGNGAGSNSDSSQTLLAWDGVKLLNGLGGPWFFPFQTHLACLIFHLICDFIFNFFKEIL